MPGRNLLDEGNGLTIITRQTHHPRQLVSCHYVLMVQSWFGAAPIGGHEIARTIGDAAH